MPTPTSCSYRQIISAGGRYGQRLQWPESVNSGPDKVARAKAARYCGTVPRRPAARVKLTGDVFVDDPDRARPMAQAGTPLDHHLSQRDVTLKTAGFSAGAVPFTEIAVAIVVAAGFGQHCVQPQQGKLMVYESRLGRRCR